MAEGGILDTRNSLSGRNFQEKAGLFETLNYVPLVMSEIDWDIQDLRGALGSISDRSVIEIPQFTLGEERASNRYTVSKKETVHERSATFSVYDKQTKNVLVGKVSRHDDRRKHKIADDEEILREGLLVAYASRLTIGVEGIHDIVMTPDFGPMILLEKIGGENVDDVLSDGVNPSLGLNTIRHILHTSGVLARGNVYQGDTVPKNAIYDHNLEHLPRIFDFNSSPSVHILSRGEDRYERKHYINSYAGVLVNGVKRNIENPYMYTNLIGRLDKLYDQLFDESFNSFPQIEQEIVDIMKQNAILPMWEKYR